MIYMNNIRDMGTDFIAVIPINTLKIRPGFIGAVTTGNLTGPVSNVILKG
jgi:hypothetical protein